VIKIRLKGIIEEDFSNYKKPSMFLAFPTCSFKCGSLCQNLPIAKSKDVEYNISELLAKYSNNLITKSVVLSGLEPFDSFPEMLEFVYEFRKVCNDDIVIYTGYEEDEITNKTRLLSVFKNIIIKFGRFVPDKEKHYDEILGVELVSPNQYAKIIS
jgi:organic radical activating enzyme